MNVGGNIVRGLPDGSVGHGEFAVSVPTALLADPMRPSQPFAVNVLCRLARWAQRRSPFHNSIDLTRTTDASNYRAWRSAELRRQLHRCFRPDRLKGLDLIDFGCGAGELTAHLLRYQPRSVLGVDRSESALHLARTWTGQTAPTLDYRLSFQQNCPARELPVEDGSVDLILCFDVLEHIHDVEAVLGDWKRGLRPGGRVWIWWSPWRGPYGHHLPSLIPIPWMHLLFSEATILSACAELYDDPTFVPRVWDRDPLNGEKRPNKWRTSTNLDGFLNRLTRSRFERLVAGVGFRIMRREIHGFRGSGVPRLTHLFIVLPEIGECFVSSYVYELVST